MSHLPSSQYIRDPKKAAEAYAKSVLTHQANKKREAANQNKAKRRRWLKSKRRRKLARMSRRRNNR